MTEKLTKNTYYSIMKMLRSSDHESQVMGLALMNNLVYKKNYAELLLLSKECIRTAYVTLTMIREHAPKLHNLLYKMNFLSLGNVMVSWSDIHTYITKSKAYDSIDLFEETYTSFYFDKVSERSEFVKGMKFEIEWKKTNK